MYLRRIVLWCNVILLWTASCNHAPRRTMSFEALGSEVTGLTFANTLNSTDSFNLFKYMYFYNGAGVGAGDFNNDGLVDLFFASNQGQNSLFLNTGNLKFSDVTRESNIPADKAWSTGVSVVDINNDGLLDLYVSRVGKYGILDSHNQFLVCTGVNGNGVPQYEDRAIKYGLDFSGFGTQAAFVDYDLDGDLDVFLLNHSVHEDGNFRARHFLKDSFSVVAGSRLYRNDGLKFADVTRESGINSSSIGYGLGICVSDINYDGYADIYIGNDFHENDYLYINQRNGTFKDMGEEYMMHTSRYSMGVDIADANNDGYAEIISVDMLPYDPYFLKRSPGEESYDLFQLKISYGYSYQYSRNALQFNRRNDRFSETGLYSGVAATDWSWAPLMFDFNNDGLKDLFISNGIPKRLNDIDYINYISDQSIQQQIIENKLNEKDQTLIEKFPQIKIPNKFYRNSGELRFEDLNDSIGNNVPTYSNGAVYADLDNDGDLDVVVNNIDADAIVYKNASNDRNERSFSRLTLRGDSSNINAVGAKVLVYSAEEVRVYEKFPVHGFLSSMEIPLHIGTEGAHIDSALLIWPDGTYQSIALNSATSNLEIKYRTGLPVFDYDRSSPAAHYTSLPAVDITGQLKLTFRHGENKFSEFNREPLIPHMLSTEGPALAIGDVNHDQMDDVFIGAARGRKSALFIQQPGGTFVLKENSSLAADSTFEDVDACWADVNNDTHPDLVVVSGGNEYYGHDHHLLPRVYLNDGAGNLVRKQDAFSGIYQTSGCVAPADFNGDGHIDMFLGGRGIPWEFGEIPESYLLQNDGTGKFTDVTSSYSPELKKAGFVTHALWLDLNNDKQKDLLLCSEWGTIDAYISQPGKLEKKILNPRKGWWNFILPVDVNNDGRVDLVAGNVGLNSRLRASESEPVRLYYNDFDGNGKKEQVLTYYLNGKEIPFANKAEIERQLPNMKKKFLYAKDFAKASLEEVFTGAKLSDANQLTADYFGNCVLINQGDYEFEISELPWEAQLTSYRDAVVVEANGDKYPDVLMVGNYYENNIEMGRYDADYGTLLINDGNGHFKYETLRNIAIKGQARKVRKLRVGGQDAFIIARNDDSTKVITFSKRQDQHTKP